MSDEVIQRDPFCSGYVDSIGNWNNGFACPPGDPEPMFCCGTATYRYCCPATTDRIGQGAEAVRTGPSSLTLILGVVFGILVSTVLIVAALFFIWRSWRARKKRPRNGGQLFCIAGGGTPSLYTGTFSRQPSRLGSPQLGEDVLLSVEEAAVRPPCRLITPCVTRTATNSFTADFGNRALLSDYSESTSSSSASDTTMEQLYANVRQPPPAYSFGLQPSHALSLTPSECTTKAEIDSRDGSLNTSAELDVLSGNRSRSSSLFKSTRF